MEVRFIDRDETLRGKGRTAQDFMSFCWRLGLGMDRQAGGLLHIDRKGFCICRLDDLMMEC